MSTQEFATVLSLKDVSEQWWDLLLSGPLWRVTMSSLPVTSHMTFQQYCLRNAAKRNRRVSIRFKEHLKYAYIQGGGRDDYMPAIRADISGAIAMIPPPAAVKSTKPDPTGHINFAEVSERLLAAQSGPSVPAAGLVDHPLLGRYVFECLCETGNFRTHDASCPCYTWLPLVEVALGRMADTPEDWYQRRQDVQKAPKSAPALPPPPSVAPFIPPATGGGSVTAPPDPWTFSGKPPAVAWDTKSLVTFEPGSDPDS